MANEFSIVNEVILLRATELLKLDLEQLKKFTLKHGINATKEIIRLATEKDVITYPKKINKQLSKTKEGAENYSKLVTEFKDELLTVGFKIFDWKEDFVDEDSGDVVEIPRFRFD